ncbi:MAG: hypothetical protein R3E66_11110 [bacterium]
MSRIIVLIALLWPSFAAGAEPGPTAVQKSLYEEAFDAYRLNRFDESITLLNAATTIKPFDLFYFSLGRAHFRRGRCVEARAAYLNALEAPEYERATEPMNERVSMALAELEKQCPGTIHVSCLYRETKVSITDQPPFSCGDTITVTPGTYEVSATIGAESRSVSVEVKAIETSEVSFDIAPPAIERVTYRTAASTPWLPVTLVSTGAALVLSSVFVDVFWLGPSIEQFEDLRLRPSDGSELSKLDQRISTSKAVVATGYVAGVGAIGTGIVLWLLDSPAAGVEVRADGGSVHWTQRW